MSSRSRSKRRSRAQFPTRCSRQTGRDRRPAHRARSPDGRPAPAPPHHYPHNRGARKKTEATHTRASSWSSCRWSSYPYSSLCQPRVPTPLRDRQPRRRGQVAQPPAASGQCDAASSPSRNTRGTWLFALAFRVRQQPRRKNFANEDRGALAGIHPLGRLPGAITSPTYAIAQSPGGQPRSVTGLYRRGCLTADL